MKDVKKGISEGEGNKTASSYLIINGVSDFDLRFNKT